MEKIIRTFVALAFAFSLAQCSKEEDQKFQPKAEKTVEIREKEKAITKNLLILAKHESFRRLILSECLKQEHGDYNIYLRKLMGIRSEDQNVNSGLTTLKPLVSRLYTLYDNNEPILFYPKAETYEKNSRKNSKIGKSTSSSIDMPVAVIGEEYVPTLQTCPGYMLTIDDQFVYFKDITEDYAWLNDMRVVGQEKDVSPENMVAAPEDVAGTQGRFEGKSEYTGYIQVTNLGEIEHWTSGKLEFNTTVFNSTGSKFWGTKRYGKWKRENFKNQKWANFGSSFIGNWNTSTYGRWMFEQWMEEDGGESSEITVSYTTPPNAQTGVPGNTISTKIPSRKRDDDLGGSLVQFTDDINQVYTITHMNFKRKNQQ